MARHYRTKRTVDSKLSGLRKRRGFAALFATFVLILGLGALLWVCKVWLAGCDTPSFIPYLQPEEETPAVVKREDVTLTGGQPPADPPIDIIVSEDTAEFASIELDNSAADGVFYGGTLPGGGLGGEGLGGGIGSDSGRGMGSRNKVESSFCGRFWDFKRTSGGADSRFKEDGANQAVLALESKFFNNGWQSGDFSNFLESKAKLYATSFYMPNCLDQEAARAYDPNGKQKLSKSRWVAVYRAKVKAPKSGRFRFVGAGDSVLAVRFDGKNVLACGFHDLKKGVWDGLHIGTSPGSAQGRDIIPYAGCEFWNDQFGGFVAGETFAVTQGEWYEMQVLVSEIGGGMFGFCLLIDDVDEDARRLTQDGKPLFQLFRTNFDAPEARSFYDSIKFPPDEEAEVDPPYDGDSMVWEAKPIDAHVK